MLTFAVIGRVLHRLRVIKFFKSFNPITMKNRLFLLLAGIAFVVLFCTNKEKTPVKVRPGTADTEWMIDLRDTAFHSTFAGSSNVSIEYDPFFKKSKNYKGFSLQHLLDSIIIALKFDTAGAVVVFECQDGYRPTMPLAQVLGDKKGFIAIRDLDAPPHQNWTDSLAQKMHPFYVVWQGVPKSDHRYAWPYGLYALRLSSAEAAFKNAYPVDAPEMVAGFRLFSQHCMKCHSVNKVGGLMGPEFNVPKNITEYWTEENIIAFAKNPQSFHYRSTMTPVVGVSDESFEKILAYLKYMAKHKITI